MSVVLRSIAASPSERVNQAGDSAIPGEIRALWSGFAKTRNLPKIRQQPRLNLARVAQAALFTQRRPRGEADANETGLVAGVVGARSDPGRRRSRGPVRPSRRGRQKGRHEGRLLHADEGVRRNIPASRAELRQGRRPARAAASRHRRDDVQARSLFELYQPPKRCPDSAKPVDQEFGGIGITVHKDEPTHRLIVMSPLPGTPAYRAGLVAGDTS